MINYYINFFQIVKDLLPHFLQKKGVLAWIDPNQFFWVTSGGESWNTGSATRHLDWLKALVAPLVSLNLSLVQFVDSIRYKMYVTGQIVYLEHYLNDIFDANQRRIYIDDGDASVPLLLYNKAEVLHFDVHNKSEGQVDPVLLNRADFADQVDFNIIIPWNNISTTEENKMKAHVIKYKNSGKRFKVTVTAAGPNYPI